MDDGTRVCESGGNFDIEAACGESNKMLELDSIADMMEFDGIWGISNDD